MRMSSFKVVFDFIFTTALNTYQVEPTASYPSCFTMTKSCPLRDSLQWIHL